MNRRPLFVHINKTGGMTIRHLLSHHFVNMLPKAHLDVKDYASRYGWRTIREERFLFTFVRNPFERMASMWGYRRKKDKHGLKSNEIPFENFLFLALEARKQPWYNNPKMFQPQVDWIRDREGSELVDYIGRYENYEDDILTLFIDRLEIEPPMNIPVVNYSDYPDLDILYTRQAKSMVLEHYEADFERFGYEPNLDL